MDLSGKLSLLPACFILRSLYVSFFISLIWQKRLPKLPSYLISELEKDNHDDVSMIMCEQFPLTVLLFSLTSPISQ